MGGQRAAMADITQGVTLTNGVARVRDGWTDDPLTSVRYELIEEGRVALISLSRPQQRNAWTEIMRNELCRCLDLASTDNTVRCVIITGDPEGRAFCFGMDLSPHCEANPTQIAGDIPPGRRVNQGNWRDGGGTAGLAIVRCTKPVIAAINGNAVGVGMTIPLCCDISVVAQDAKVGFVFGKRGLTMECLSSYFLERCIGHKSAMELVLTGRVFKGSEAPAGLFNYAVPADQVLQKALELAQEICGTSAMSTYLNRMMIMRNSLVSPEQAHLIESRCISWSTGQPDCLEGIQSFIEKRPADFKMDPFKDSPEFVPWWWEVQTKARL